MWFHPLSTKKSHPVNNSRPADLRKAVPHCSVSNCAQTTAILRRYDRTVARSRTPPRLSPVRAAFVERGELLFVTNTWLEDSQWEKE